MGRMKAYAILCISLVAIIYEVSCCTKKNPKVTGNVWQRLVGKDILTGSYTGSGDEVVETCDKLNCDFEGSCCWSNAQSPPDQLDWESVSGETEPKKMQSTFGTQTAPTGSALGVGSERASDGKSQQAQLYSCAVECANGQIAVSMQHWQSTGVLIKVCEETDPAGPLKNCQQLPTTSGESDTVNLPGGKNVRLVIVAEGFTDRKGSVAMIDNMNVQCDACVTSTTSTTAAPTEAPTAAPTTQRQATTVAPNVCKTLTCDFDQHSTCAYKLATDAGGTKQFEPVRPPWQNRLTGIPVTAHGPECAGAYLNPGETAAMYTDVPFPDGYIVRAQGYRATEGIDLMACCDTAGNCPFTTTNKVQTADYRQWKTIEISCPSGTKKLYFKAVNSGQNYGAAGLDNIQVISKADKSPQC